MFSGRVPADINAHFERICQSKGISPYEFIQLTIDMIVRYMDEDLQLSEDLNKMIQRFDWECGNRYCLGTNDDTDNLRAIREAVYIFGSHKHQGSRAVLVEPAFMSLNSATETYNVQRIVETVLEAADPVLVRKLKDIAADQGTNGLLETIIGLADSYNVDTYGRDLRELFSDNRRSEFGHEENTTPYRRKMHKSIDSPLPSWATEPTLFHFADDN